MVLATKEKEFASYVVELLQTIGPVRSKRMFGGFGMFLEDLMFGLIAGNELYLKVDVESRTDFEDLGLSPFVYNKNGKSMEMSYFQPPEEAMEDSEIMAEWANKAYSAALRAAAKKPKHKAKKKSRKT